MYFGFFCLHYSPFTCFVLCCLLVGWLVLFCSCFLFVWFVGFYAHPYIFFQVFHTVFPSCSAWCLSLCGEVPLVACLPRVRFPLLPVFLWWGSPCCLSSYGEVPLVACLPRVRFPLLPVFLWWGSPCCLPSYGEVLPVAYLPMVRFPLLPVFLWWGSPCCSLPVCQFTPKTRWQQNNVWLLLNGNDEKCNTAVMVIRRYLQCFMSKVLLPWKHRTVCKEHSGTGWLGVTQW